MNQLKLFLLMILLGGAGGALGSVAGGAFGRGGVFAGGFVGGPMLVVIATLLAERWGWTRGSQRPWVMAGGVLGFLLAALVTLSTLSSPVGPTLSTLLIGTGAVLGAIVGQSAHTEA